MRRINVYGGPGIGKSTVSAALFALLKREGHNVELVSEWIKSWAWQNIKPDGFDQLYIFAKQLRKEDVVLRNGGIVISDSPLLMQLAYIREHPVADTDLFVPLHNLATCYEKVYPSLNIMLERDPSHPYKQSGRYQTEEQAHKLDDAIHRILETQSIPHEHFRISELETIGSHILTRIRDE